MRLSRTVIVRLTEGEHEAVTRIAGEQCRSRAFVVRAALREHLARRHEPEQVPA